MLCLLPADIKEVAVNLYTKLSSTIFVAVLVAVSSWTTYGQQDPIVVSPLNQHGWTTADTRPGGAVTFVVDMTAPSGNGALQLTTDLTTTAKAQYMHDTNTLLSSVTELGYYTKQNSATFPEGAPSYQLATCLGGVMGATCIGFTTLVFEPYQNPELGPVVPGTWQNWDVDQGLFWSSKTFMCPNGTIVGTSGGPATYTLSAIKTACPNAVVVQYGVNVGSNNPGYNVETDLFDFNGTVYDFEPLVVIRNKDQCKDGGWRTGTREDGTGFKNQGECVSYANHLQ
jgi:hypothetical protein